MFHACHFVAFNSTYAFVGFILCIVPTCVSPSPTVEPMPQECVGGAQEVASAGRQYAFIAVVVVCVVLAVLFLLSLLIIIILVVWVARLNKQMKTMEGT